MRLFQPLVAIFIGITLSMSVNAATEQNTNKSKVTFQSQSSKLPPHPKKHGKTKKSATKTKPVVLASNDQNANKASKKTAAETTKTDKKAKPSKVSETEFSGDVDGAEEAAADDTNTLDEEAVAENAEANTAAQAAVAQSFQHFYVMGQFGWGTQDINSGVQKIFGIEILGVTSNIKSGIAGGGHFGYRVNRWASFEIGGMKYSNAQLEQTLLIVKRKGGVARSFDVDLLAVLTLPLEHGLTLFAKAGPALVHTQFRVPGFLKEDSGVSQTDLIPHTFEKSRTSLRPELGAGLGFKWSKHFGTEIAYYIIFEQKGTIESRYLPELDFLGAGLKYSF